MCMSNTHEPHRDDWHNDVKVELNFMMTACRCASRTHIVMLSLWFRHGEEVHAGRVKERACLTGRQAV